jgi:hypothetical protein
MTILGPNSRTSVCFIRAVSQLPPDRAPAGEQQRPIGMGKMVKLISVSILIIFVKQRT